MQCNMVPSKCSYAVWLGRQPWVWHRLIAAYWYLSSSSTVQQKTINTDWYNRYIITANQSVSCQIWLCLFGHVARMGDSRDLSRALHTSIHGLLKDWRRHPGHLRHTWLRTLEADLQPLNHGLNSAWRQAQDRGCWKQLVETATLQSGARQWWWWLMSLLGYLVVMLTLMS